MFLFDPLYWECFGERAKELFVDKPKAAAQAAKNAYELGRDMIRLNSNLRKYLPAGLLISAVGGLGLMQLGHAKQAPEIPVQPAIIPETSFAPPQAVRSDWVERVGGIPAQTAGFASRMPEQAAFYTEKISLETLEQAAKKIHL